MKKSRRILRKIIIALLVLVVFVSVMSIVNLIGYSANMRLAKDNIPVEIRDLELYMDELGYWTFVMDENNDFRILQLTDIHIGNGFMSFNKDNKALNAVRELVNYSKPDLIVVTGDMVYPVIIQAGSGNNRNSTKLFSEFMNSFKIPWTVTFGNHDDEVYSWFKLDKMADIYSSYDYCLFKTGPQEVKGLSNYFINILNNDLSLNTTLVMFDSNSYTSDWRIKQYDNIHDCQVEWYEQELYRVSDYYGVEGLVKSLAFFHIPLNEYEDAWQLYKQGSGEVEYHFGQAGEPGEKVFAPHIRGSLFDKMVELGSTKGIFCGHDHLNDFSITYQGIRLTYGKSIDYLAYFLTVPGFMGATWQRGGTVITIDQEGSFDIEQLVLVDIIA